MTTTIKINSQNTRATGAKNPPPAPIHFQNPNKKSSNSMRMKSTSLTLAAAAVLAALPLANAQNVTATTDPVGFQAKTIPVGVTPLANPLINSNSLTAQVSSNTASVVSLSSSDNLATILNSTENAGSPFYVEVVSGALEGERWEVNLSSTIASGNAEVTIDTASPNNTSTLVASALVGSTLALRKHVTLSQLQSFFSPALVGNNNAASADQISVYNPSSDTFTNYFLRGDNLTWRIQGTSTTASKFSIPPGTGFLVTKRQSSTTFTSVGSVRTNDFSFPMPQGSSFRAAGYPISYSPAGLGGTLTNGWTGNNNANSADQLQVYNPSTDTFTNYFLRGDGVTWRIQGTSTAVTSDQLFSDNSAFMVLKRQADTDYVLVSPITQ
jgi:hypothetical protein